MQPAPPRDADRSDNVVPDVDDLTPRPTVHVLVVDDSPDDVAFVRRLLRSSFDTRFVVRHYETARAGLQALADETPDCVILDYRLPDLNGFEFIEAMQGYDPDHHVPIVFLTGAVDVETAVKALKSGVTDYLVKSRLTRTSLQQTVLSAVRTATALRAAAAAQKALVQSEERYRTLVAVTAQVVWTSSPEGDIREPQPSWEHATGQCWSEYAADGWLAAICPDDRPLVLAEWKRARKRQLAFRLNNRLRWHDGDYRHMQVRVAPVFGITGELIEWVGCMTDITEDIRTREALEAAHARTREAAVRLEEARQVAVKATEAKSRFLATMSHELRTPLHAIAGHLKMLELGVHGTLNDAQRQALSRVERAKGHLLGLISSVLDLSREEIGRPRYDITRVRLAHVFDEVTPMIETQVTAKSITWKVILPDRELAVLADQAKLRQVLLNLLSNAVKFTPAHGEVTLDATTDGGWQHTDGVSRVLVRVSDTGFGIRPDALESLFEPFSQLRDSHGEEGSGLGLAISRELTRGMDGELSVNSAVGRGSTFTISLQRA